MVAHQRTDNSPFHHFSCRCVITAILSRSVDGAAWAGDGEPRKVCTAAEAPRRRSVYIWLSSSSYQVFNIPFYRVGSYAVSVFLGVIGITPPTRTYALPNDVRVQQNWQQLIVSPSGQEDGVQPPGFCRRFLRGENQLLRTRSIITSIPTWFCQSITAISFNSDDPTKNLVFFT